MLFLKILFQPGHRYVEVLLLYLLEIGECQKIQEQIRKQRDGKSITASKALVDRTTKRKMTYQYKIVLESG